MPKKNLDILLKKNLPSLILSQGSQHIIHVKDVRALMEYQSTPMLPWPVMSQQLPASISCISRLMEPRASLVTQGKCPWSTAALKFEWEREREASLQELLGLKIRGDLPEYTPSRD